MSIAAIATLLQSALLLLTMAQSAAGLPQSFRDNAVTVAQQAISQATAALAVSSTSSTTSIIPTANQIFTTPSGAVINAQGNLVRAPAGANTLPALSITVGTMTAQTTSIHLEWDTSIPTESKVFFQPSGGATQIIPSKSGNSTHHIVDLTNLRQAATYSYTIEAIAGEQDQKLSGTMRIYCPLTGGCAVRTD